MRHLSLRRFMVLFAAAAVLAVTPLALACPFCAQQKGPTLLGDYKQAAIVLVGKFANARLDANSGLENGTTDFVIEETLKDNPILKGKMTITLPRYIPPTKSKYVLFCDVFKGKIDPYRLAEVQPGSDLVRYLKGALKIKDRPIGERLRYCFDYVQSKDLEVSLDAYREFARASYDDYRGMAKALPANTIAGWLQDSNTPSYRYGLYASLLGHCGKDEHAKLLREMLDKSGRQSSGVDGILAGYLMLLHKEGHTKDGLTYVRGLLTDRKQPFLMRYSALRTLRFFWDTRPDVFSKKDLADSVALLLDQPDMADFAIEDLAKWEQWNRTDQILGLFNKTAFNAPVVKRAILRYALRCPEPRAKEFVRQQRARDAEWVNDTEELLRLETPAPAAPVKGAAASK
jgi:hypothetical protein